MFRRKTHKFAHSAPIISEPYNPRLFNDRCPTVTQTVNVTVNEVDDGIAECIKGCFSCCVSGAKIAAKS